MKDSDYDEIRRALKDRSSWEIRQDTWYRMRHSGIRRSYKPYEGAPDQHYPLVDTVIEKLKPFYIQQPYAQDRFATFRSKKGEGRQFTGDAEQFFDYQLKQKSNFETALMIATDTHLTYGVCPIKIFWDEDAGQLAFDPIDPLYIIVPTWTEDLQGADWLVHVKRLSKSQYLASKIYKQAEGLTDRISGRGSAQVDSGFQKEQTVYSREGLTYTPDKQQIIIWECYQKQKDGTWLIETISPVIGPNEPLRKPFKNPYAHGKLPFIDLRLDLSEKGYYSSRGIAEILLPHELALNKSWNSKLQFMDFFGQPNFTNDSLQPFNALDFKNAPGAILPPGIKPVPPQQTPIDFVEEMQFTRALAEDRIKVPDLDSSEHLTGPSSSTGKPTATQINAIVGLSSQSNDMRARFYRLQLGQVYSMAWQLITEFAKDDVKYLTDEAQQELPPDALKDIYTISPSGSADNWNSALRQTKAIAIYQLLLGKPNVEQDELLKFLLESGTDPTLVKRLYQDTGMESQDQSQIQAQENLLMQDGFLPQVKPAHNHPVHLQTIASAAQKKMQTGESITPHVAGLVVQHATEHAQAIIQSKNKQGKQAIQQFHPTLQMLQQIAARGPQPPPQQGQAGPPPGSPPQPGSEDKPSSVMTALAALIKAGVVLAPADINAILVKAGLPPGAAQVTPPPAAPATLGGPVAPKAPRAGKGLASAPQAPAAPPAPPGAPAMAQGGVVHHMPLEVHVPASPPPAAPVVNIPPQPAPVVNVPPPDMSKIPPPIVHVPPHPKVKSIVHERDKSGKIIKSTPTYE